MHHRLKTVEPFFSALASGEKTAELRYDDRGFAVGDVIQFELWDEDRGWGGHFTNRRVTHILRDSDGPWLKHGFVMLSLALP